MQTNEINDKEYKASSTMNRIRYTDYRAWIKVHIL